MDEESVDGVVAGAACSWPTRLDAEGDQAGAAPAGLGYAFDLGSTSQGLRQLTLQEARLGRHRDRAGHELPTGRPVRKSFPASDRFLTGRAHSACRTRPPTRSTILAPEVSREEARLPARPRA